MKALLWLCLFCSLCLGKQPFILTDANFEHDT
jgi:hypothetical protein